MTFQKSLKDHRSSLWEQLREKMKSADKNIINAYIKRRFETTLLSSYQSPSAPKQTVDDIKQHLKSVFGESQRIQKPDDNSPCVPVHPPIEDPFNENSVQSEIKKSLPLRKAPGSDQITAEMLTPIHIPLSTILTPFIDLCYRYS